MAIDTRSRRASILGLALAWQLTLPLPDATVGQEDRQHVAYCYAGIAAGASNEVIATADVIIQVRPDDISIRVRPDDDEVVL